MALLCNGEWLEHQLPDLLDVRFRNGRKLGTVEEYFASTLMNGDTFYFAGLVLEVERGRRGGVLAAEGA